MSSSRRRRSSPIKPKPRNDRPSIEVRRNSNSSAEAQTTNGLPLLPQQRLELTSRGQAPLRREDLQSLLAGHVVESDNHVRYLGKQKLSLLEMLLDSSKGKSGPDPRTALDLLCRLDRLHNDGMAQVRRTVELLHRISAPPRADVRVVAAGRQVNIAAQQVNAPPDPGSVEAPL